MKKKDLKLELYVAQTQIAELKEQIEQLNDQGPLIKVLFEKLYESQKKEKEQCPIDLERVAAAL